MPPSPRLATLRAADIIALLGVLGFAISMRYYDAASFLGIRANNEGNIGSDDAPFVISPLHRFVRHPWYFFSLLVIWSRDMSSSSLVTTLMIIGYFLIGSWLDETKLVAEIGDAYANYRTKVGGIVPLPWRHLSVSEADAIARTAQPSPDLNKSLTRLFAIKTVNSPPETSASLSKNATPLRYTTTLPRFSSEIFGAEAQPHTNDYRQCSQPECFAHTPICTRDSQSQQQTFSDTNFPDVTPGRDCT